MAMKVTAKTNPNPASSQSEQPSEKTIIERTMRTARNIFNSIYSFPWKSYAKYTSVTLLCAGLIITPAIAILGSSLMKTSQTTHNYVITQHPYQFRTWDEIGVAAPKTPIDIFDIAISLSHTKTAQQMFVCPQELSFFETLEDLNHPLICDEMDVLNSILLNHDGQIRSEEEIRELKEDYSDYDLDEELATAADCCIPSLIPILLELGANPNYCSKRYYNKTALVLLFNKLNFEALKFRELKLDLSAYKPTEKKHKEEIILAIKFLIKKGAADTTILDRALYRAIKDNDFDGVPFLLDLGANPNSVGWYWSWNSYSVLETLVLFTSDELALKEEIIKILVDKGAKFGRSLHYAAQSSPSIVPLLLELGADPNKIVFNEFRWSHLTPLDELLYSWDHKLNYKEIRYDETKIKVFKTLIRKGGKIINALDNTNAEQINAWLSFGIKEIPFLVPFLIEKRHADLNFRDDNGNTLLELLLLNWKEDDAEERINALKFLLRNDKYIINKKILDTAKSHLDKATYKLVFNEFNNWGII